jgi:hypothetical protein
MPRSQSRKEVPRWKRGKPPQQPQQVIQVRGRNARALVREINIKQAGDGDAPGGQPARTGLWRHRRSLPPLVFGAALVIAGLAMHASPYRDLSGWLSSIVVPVLLVLFTRHLSAFARRWCDVAAVFASAWLPALAISGLGKPAPLLLVLTWLPLAVVWIRHYRIAPETAPAEFSQPAEDTSSDAARWERLAAKRKWSGSLRNPETIPGGRKWEIALDGSETNIGEVLGQPRALAAAFDKAMTEAYVEPHPTGVESRGVLTLLKAGTLQAGHDWDGKGFNEQGIARIGRFADSQPVRIRVFVPRDGTRHSLIAGTTRAGKSELLNLILWLAIQSEVPIVPVILDPQNGQSLPQWRGKVLYAAGVEECARLRRGLNAGMMDRSTRLASMAWDDEGHTAKGFNFFDARLCGLPIVMVITDEAPVLLSGGGNASLAAEMIRLTAEAGKLGGKVGDAELVVAQVPSLGELGDQALRSMLVGGNVIGLRTGDKVSGGMAGLEADPHALPKYFPNGEPTYGLGYAVTMDNRQAPMRTDMVPSRMRHQAVTVPSLEPEFLEAMDRAMGGISPTAAFPVPAVKAAEEADDGPEGRTCADAVLQVLADRRAEMERGEVIKWTGELVTSGWGRAKPFSIKSVGNALGALTTAGTVVKVRDGVYKAAAASAAAREGE